jgi:hypothetical protein
VGKLHVVSNRISNHLVNHLHNLQGCNYLVEKDENCLS